MPFGSGKRKVHVAEVLQQRWCAFWVFYSLSDQINVPHAYRGDWTRHDMPCSPDIRPTVKLLACPVDVRRYPS